jgi:hypothetical protein
MSKVFDCLFENCVGQLLKWLYNPNYWQFIPTYDKRQLRFQYRNTVKDIKNAMKGDIKKVIKRFKDLSIKPIQP